MVASFKHFYFCIVTNSVNQVDFQEWLASYEIPNNRFVIEVFVVFVVKHIVNSALCNIPWHPFV